MENKLSTSLSALALIVSVVSATFTFKDSKRTDREQLSKAVSELIGLNQKNITWSNIPLDKRDPSYYNEGSILTQTVASVTRQAVYLINNDPEIVNDVDYVTIAQGLFIVGDYQLSDNYRQKAVDASPSDLYKIFNLRGYADFLFSQGKFEQAREKYRLALKIFNDDTDFNKTTNCYTYQMWMVSEFSKGFKSNAENNYQNALRTCNRISDQNVKSYSLNMLNNARSYFNF
ncbi:MAG: tetratricopeptide repeat protein [Chlorobiaceae bacterium]|nr:tetratricopeptide repeat protein [Chlorobiaceae bacterium]